MLFNIFMRQTLTNDFWGLHKNINCTFFLIDDGSQDKKAEGTKKCVIKEKLNLKIMKTV